MRLPTLNQFFRHQLQRGFHAHGLTEPATVDYVSELLTRFSQSRALYALHDTAGRPLEYIVDMLQERQWAQSPEQGARNFARERLVTQHIGEYALFMSGLFRERVQARGQLNYYIAQGSSAYWHCADYEPNGNRQRVYRRLYYGFAHISNILNHLRHKQFPMARPANENMLVAFWRA